MQCVRQTKNTVAQRFNSHFYNIRHYKQTDAVGPHFCLKDHKGVYNISNETWVALIPIAAADQCFPDYHTRHNMGVLGLDLEPHEHCHVQHSYAMKIWILGNPQPFDPCPLGMGHDLPIQDQSYNSTDKLLPRVSVQRIQLWNEGLWLVEAVAHEHIMTESSWDPPKYQLGGVWGPSKWNSYVTHPWRTVTGDPHTVLVAL